MQYSITEDKQGRYHFTYHESFQFENGENIKPLTLVYETYGKLNAQKDNVILIHHALSTHSHVASHAKYPQAGWWENMVGPNKPIDSNKYYIICINNLASCFGSSGPTSIDPNTNKPYQAHFPHTTITDMVNSQRLLLQTLGIHKLFAIIGNSVGAMLSLTWAILYPEDVDKLISVSSCYKTYPTNDANRALQRDIIQLDPDWCDGFYSQQPLRGFYLARKHALLTYRNWEELNERFKDKTGKASLHNYLDYNANKFIHKFDLNSYMYLLNAMDGFNVCHYYKDKKTTFSRLGAQTFIISVNTDVLYTPDQQIDLYDELKNVGADVKFIQHRSIVGHDAFLVDTEQFGQYFRDFLAKPL